MTTAAHHLLVTFPNGLLQTYGPYSPEQPDAFSAAVKRVRKWASPATGAKFTRLTVASDGAVAGIEPIIVK